MKGICKINMKSIEVSVVIPTYNRKSTLKRAIDSILNQSFQDYEIVIVDDCSTDGSLEYIAELYGQLDNLIYIRNDNNIGAGASRNVGVLYASGKYIAFHDSDDEWLPNKLERQMEVIKNSDDDIGLVYSYFKFVSKDGRECCFPSTELEKEKKTGEVFRTLLIQPLAGTITWLMKRDLFLELGGFNEKLKALEDYEFTLRIGQKYKIVLVEEILAIAYQTKDSVSADGDNHILTECYIMDKYQKELEKNGLIEEKFFAVLNVARIFNKVREFLKYIVHKYQNTEYQEYVKFVLRQLDEGKE